MMSEMVIAEMTGCPVELVSRIPMHGNYIEWVVESPCGAWDRVRITMSCGAWDWLAYGLGSPEAMVAVVRVKCREMRARMEQMGVVFPPCLSGCHPKERK